MFNFLKKIQVFLLVTVFVISPLLVPKKARAVAVYKVPQVVALGGVSYSSGSYFPPAMSQGFSGAEANAQFRVPKAGTFSGLAVRVSSANASASSVFTFRINGVAGNQTATATQSSTGLFRDTTNSDVVAVGDLVSIRLATSAGTIGLSSITVLFEADDGTSTQFLMARGDPAGITTNSLTRYFTPAGTLPINEGVENAVKNYIQNTTVASDFAVYISANTRTTNTIFGIRKNGATTGATVTVGSGVTGLVVNSSNTSSLVAGDLVNYIMTTSTGGNTITFKNMQMTLTSSNPREITLMGGSRSTRSSAAGATYGAAIGNIGIPLSSTESNFYGVLNTDAVISKFSLNVISNASNRDITIALRKNAGTATNTFTSPQAVTGWLQDTTHSDTYDFNDLTSFIMNNPSSAGTGNIVYGGTSMLATFPAVSAIEQSAYRFFNNNNSADVGSALNTQDTAATLGSTGDAFRLRMLLHVTEADIAISGESFKLQFAEKSGTCDTAFSGETYADVTGATVISYNDNATPADGDNLTSNANDPTHGADTITNQDYEEANNFTNSVSSIPVGQDGKWDFSLIDNGATVSTSYCFRVVKSDGTALDTYTVIPEIITAASGGALSVDIVDAGSASVASPSVDMSAINFSFSNQTSTGTFGISSEKIRVDNGTGTAVWTLSLAADGGATSFWNGVSSDYDFNDPTAGAGDGGDADSLGGQMTLDPSASTITPEGGCTLTNISSGSSTAFNQGVTDSITLASATTGADTGCYWDITDINISQTIPAEQPADSYSVDMTLSIIAS